MRASGVHPGGSRLARRPVRRALRVRPDGRSAGRPRGIRGSDLRADAPSMGCSDGVDGDRRPAHADRRVRDRDDGCRWLHADCASSRPCVLDLAHRAAARSAAASVDRRTPRRTSSPDAQPRRSCAPPTASRECCSSSSPRCPTPACASCGGGCASTTTPQRPSVTSRPAVANASPCGRGAPPRCGPHRFAGPGHRRASDSSSASPAEPFPGALPR